MTPGRPVRCFAWTVVTVGAACLVLAATLAAEAPDHPPVSPAVVLLVVLLLVGELLPVSWLDRSGGVEITSSWGYAGALVLLGHWPLALAGIALGSVAGDLRGRKDLLRAAFNAAQLALSLTAAMLVLAAGGRLASPWTQRLHAGDLFWLLAAGTAVLAVNTVLIRTVMALDRQEPLRTVLRPSVAEPVADATDMAVAPLYALAVGASPWLLPLVLVVSWRVQFAIRRQAGQHRAVTCDGVTGLLNAAAFRERLQATLAMRAAPPTAVALIRFADHGELAARYGSVVSDLALAELAGRLRRLMGRNATLSRMDADVLALAAPVGDERTLQVVMEELARDLRRPALVRGALLEVSVHIGVSVYPHDGVDVPQLLDRAGAALHQAAQSGATVCRHRGDERRPGAWLGSELLAELRQAVAAGDLHLVYQPVLDLETAEVLGAEALVRWDHPRRGAIQPDAFIPLAEQTGAITVVTEFVLDEGTAQLARWHAEGRDLSLAVNISARDLIGPTFAQAVVERLDRLGVAHDRLELEVTENAMSRDWDISKGVLQRLHDHGVRLAVDDFGTGYSSLTHLKDVPFDTIKLDRSFVQELGASPQAAVIVRSVLGLARGMGARSLAEGIESAGTHQELRGLGCQAGQGYLFSEPLSGRAFETWLATGSVPLPASA